MRSRCRGCSAQVSYVAPGSRSPAYRVRADRQAAGQRGVGGQFKVCRVAMHLTGRQHMYFATSENQCIVAADEVTGVMGRLAQIGAGGGAVEMGPHCVELVRAATCVGLQAQELHQFQRAPPGHRFAPPASSLPLCKLKCPSQRIETVGGAPASTAPGIVMTIPRLRNVSGTLVVECGHS